MKRNKGFTLIELLVVIAIIGILSAIVLASLSTARTKANASKVQSQMASLRAAAEIYYSNNPTTGYGTAALPATACVTTGSNVFGDTISGAAGLITAVNGTSGVTAANTRCAIGTSGASWAATANIPGGVAPNLYWCVDSTGASKWEPDNGLGTGGSEKCA